MLGWQWLAGRVRRLERGQQRARRASVPPLPRVEDSGLRLFKLTENLNSKNHASPWAYCNPCYWGSQKDQWIVDTNMSLLMVDTVGLYYGLTNEYLWGRLVGWGEHNVTIVEARSHGAPTHEGKLDGSLAAAGTATFSIWTKASGSWADSTVNVTVNAPPRLSSGSIAIGKWGRIYYELTAPGWTLDSAEC